LATAVACAVLIGAAVIAWQVYSTKTTEQRLAQDAKASREGADRGDAKAETRLAYMYSLGLGVPQDYDEALRWYRKAADQGNAVGEDGVGYVYLNGRGVPQDYAEALSWFRKAADLGDARGEKDLGLMYEHGAGVPQDYNEALRWLRKAADQRYAPAEYDLGNMYYYGRGVPQDYAEAVRWYQKAANQGDEYAQHVLHWKWKGMSTFSKIANGTMLLGSLVFLIGLLMPGGSIRGGGRRRLVLAGLIGLSYVALDLLGFRYLGILTPVMAIGGFHFVRSLVGGTWVAVLLPVVMPSRIWLMVIRIWLGLCGILFIGFNLMVLASPKLRSISPTLGSFWSLNGNLLGNSIPLAVFLWLTKKKARLEQSLDSEIAASDSPIDVNGDRP
jgi:hypothetical protein